MKHKRGSDMHRLNSVSKLVAPPGVYNDVKIHSGPQQYAKGSAVNKA